MFALKIDARSFVANLDDVGKRQLPFATMQALNQTMFEVREDWKAAMLREFDEPTPLTLGSILYRKATKARLVAEVFIRDEASKGTPPSAYLIAEVEGGARAPKPFEEMLRSRGVLGSGEFAVPATGSALNEFGNVRGGVTRAVLADLDAVRGSAQGSTADTRGKRARRNRKREGSGVYFYNRSQRGRLPRGIYERLSRGFVGPRRGGGGQGGVRMVFAIVSTPHYAVRFDAYKLAQTLFDRRFPSAFQVNLARAIASAKPGKGGP